MTIPTDIVALVRYESHTALIVNAEAVDTAHHDETDTMAERARVIAVERGVSVLRLDAPYSLHHAERHQRFYELLADHCGKRDAQRRAARALVGELPAEAQVQLQMMVKKTHFERRCYSRGHFYCWAHHPLLRLARPGDPWPAARYPKDVLMAEFATAGAV